MTTIFLFFTHYKEKKIHLPEVGRDNYMKKNLLAKIKKNHLPGPGWDTSIRKLTTIKKILQLQKNYKKNYNYKINYKNQNQIYENQK